MNNLFFLEIKKNGTWISSGISANNLPEINTKMIEFLKLNGRMEIRIIQKPDPIKIKPRKGGCCGH